MWNGGWEMPCPNILQPGTYRWNVYNVYNMSVFGARCLYENNEQALFWSIECPIRLLSGFVSTSI